MKVAKERKSSVLASNAVHHRIDSLTGIVTLAVILGANFLENAAWLDPVGGLLVSLMVVKAGAENTFAALFELADKGIDDEVKTSVRKHLRRTFSDIPDGHQIELRDVSGIKSGQNYLVDLEVAHHGLTEIRVVETMHQRKQAFTDLSDGFVTLPGGTGTMDELWEALSWAQLGYHAKPVGLLNVAG